MHICYWNDAMVVCLLAFAFPLLRRISLPVSLVRDRLCCFSSDSAGSFEVVDLDTQRTLFASARLHKGLTALDLTYDPIAKRIVILADDARHHAQYLVVLSIRKSGGLQPKISVFHSSASKVFALQGNKFAFLSDGPAIQVARQDAKHPISSIIQGGDPEVRGELISSVWPQRGALLCAKNQVAMEAQIPSGLWVARFDGERTVWNDLSKYVRSSRQTVSAFWGAEASRVFVLFGNGSLMKAQWSSKAGLSNVLLTPGFSKPLLSGPAYFDAVRGDGYVVDATGLLGEILTGGDGSVSYRTADSIRGLDNNSVFSAIPGSEWLAIFDRNGGGIRWIHRLGGRLTETASGVVPKGYRFVPIH